MASTRLSSGVVVIRDDDRATRIVAVDPELTGRGRTELDLVARVLSQKDTPVEGASVRWSSDVVAVPTGALRSDSNGEVLIRVTLPSQPGTLRVTAALEGSDSVANFDITVEGNLRDLFDPEAEENGRDLGGSLDTLCTTAEGEMGELCDYLYDLDVSDQKVAVEALSPDALPIKGDVAMQAARTQLSNIQQRQQQLRSGAGGGFDQLGVNLQGKSVAVGQLANGIQGYSNPRQDFDQKIDQAMNKATSKARGGEATKGVQQSEETKGAATVLEERGESRLGFFVNGRISVGEHELTSREPGYDVTTRGITTGVDYKLSKNAYAGAAIGYLDGETDLASRSGQLDTSGYSFTLYSGYQWQRLYADLAVSQTWIDFDVQRDIVLPQDFQGQTRFTALGSTDSSQQGASLGLGYDWNLGSLGLNGFTRGLYNRVEIDSFNETGAGVLNLELGEQEVTSILYEAGLEASYPLSFSWGVMNPVARFSYFHEFENDVRVLGGSFVFDSSNETFNLFTDTPDRNYFNLGLGLQFTFAKSRLLYFMFDTDLARDDLDLYTLTFGYRQQF